MTDDYAADMDTTGLLMPGQTIHAKFDYASDIDWFKTTLEGGVTYEFRLTGANGGGGSAGGGYPRMLALGLAFWQYGRSDELYSDGGKGGDPLFVITPTTSGDYYLRASSYYEAAGGTYTLSAALAKDDFSASLSTSGRLAVGGAVDGQLELAGDRDWFKVTLTAGANYWFDLTHTKAGGDGDLLATYNEAILHLYDAQGKAIPLLTGPNPYRPSLSFAALESGDYYVEVSSSMRNSGAYTLQASTGAPDDYGNGSSSAAAIAVGDTVAGAVEIWGDVDWFKATLQQGHRYVVDLQDLHGPSLTPMLEVRGSDGALLYQHVEYEPSGTASRVDPQITFIADRSGDFYLTAQAYSYPHTGTGNYQLKLSEAVDDYAATNAGAGQLQFGQSTSGTIDYVGDVDRFQLSLVAGHQYMFTMSGGAANKLSLSNKLGDVLTGSGGLARTGDAALMVYKPTVSGTYYLDAGSELGTHGSYAIQAIELSGADKIRPTLATGTPEAGALYAPLKQDIELHFNEAIRFSQTSGSVFIFNSQGSPITLAGVGTDQFTSISGNTLTVHLWQALDNNATYRVALDAGAVTDLSGNPNAAFSYSFHTVDADVRLSGTAANDVFIPMGSGNDSIDGLAGRDTVAYAGARASYTVTHAGAGFTVQDQSGATGTDQLSNVERIAFSDGNIALDVDGVAGQAYRIYRAALNRTPDESGLGFWIDSLDHGSSLAAVAHEFLNSAEFTRLYGSPDNAGFVTLLYANVLHRVPDSAGYDFWLDGLKHGSTREALLQGFSESPENHDAVAALIANGVAYLPFG